MKILLKILGIILLLAVFSGGIYFFLNSSEGKTEIFNSISKPTAKPSIEKEVTFLAVGDIMLSRDVAARMSKNGKDGNYPFTKIKSLLASTDFNFGNLESPFSGTDAQDPDPNTFTFNAPTYAIKGLKENNFKVLNLANNHALNQGVDGLLYTKKFLTSNSILNVGAGADKDASWEGIVYEDTDSGIKIGFAGATYGPTSENLAQISELQHLKETVDALKAKSDFVVITMHAGTEYQSEENFAQIRFAKAAIDYGADMVIGAHPHWIQPYETYKDKYIFYSLGNFVFDQDWSKETSEGLTLKISLSKIDGQTTPKQVELIPVIIENNSQPRVATEAEKKKILNEIGAENEMIK